MYRSRLGAGLFEGGLAATPILAALVVLGLGWNTEGIASALVVVTFMCALGLLLVDLMGENRLANFGRLILVGGFVVWYAYPGVVGELVPGYGPEGGIGAGSRPETKIWVVVCLSSFLLSGILTMALLRRRLVIRDVPARNQAGAGSLTAVLASSACLVGLATPFVFGEDLRAIIAAILEGRSVAKPWIQQENLGNTVSALTSATSSVMVAGAALGWIGAGHKYLGFWKRIALALLAGLVSTVIYIDHGTRSLLVLVVGPAVALWWVSQFQRSKIRSLAILGMMAPLAFIVLQVQMLYRLQSTRANMGDLLLERWLTLGGAIDFFQETMIALELVPETHGYFQESVILQFLTSPIPRFLWTEKPFSEVVWFYTLQRWNVDIELSPGNVLPGVIGQFYMSWGMIGPALGGALFGLILVALERRLAKVEGRGDRFSLGVGAMAGLWVFVSFRLLSPGFAYPVLVAAGIVWAGAHWGRVRRQGFVWSARGAARCGLD